MTEDARTNPLAERIARLTARFEASERRHAMVVESIATEMKALQDRISALESAPSPSKEENNG